MKLPVADAQAVVRVGYIDGSSRKSAFDSIPRNFGDDKLQIARGGGGKTARITQKKRDRNIALYAKRRANAAQVKARKPQLHRTAVCKRQLAVQTQKAYGHGQVAVGIRIGYAARIAEN